LKFLQSNITLLDRAVNILAVQTLLINQPGRQGILLNAPGVVRNLLSSNHTGWTTTPIPRRSRIMFGALVAVE
jgi:hypothetical protein